MSDTLFFFYLGLLFLQVQFLQRLLVSKWAVPSQNKLQYEPDLMLVVFLASSSCEKTMQKSWADVAEDETRNTL